VKVKVMMLEGGETKERKKGEILRSYNNGGSTKSASDVSHGGQMRFGKFSLSLKSISDASSPCRVVVGLL
jgi:hypothetical protein